MNLRLRVFQPSGLAFRVRGPWLFVVLRFFLSQNDARRYQLLEKEAGIWFLSHPTTSFLPLTQVYRLLERRAKVDKDAASFIKDRKRAIQHAKEAKAPRKKK
jgi:hypothetical protein